MSASRMVIASFFVLACAFVANAQGRATASVAADQSMTNCPIKIMSVEGHGSRDFVNSVEVKNVSAKIIVRYRLSWIFRDAEPATVGFVAGNETYGSFLGNPVQANIGPNSSDVAPPQGVLPMDTTPMLESRHASDHVFIVVGVAQVEFKDGTTWTADAGDFMLHHSRVAGKSTRIVPVADSNEALRSVAKFHQNENASAALKHPRITTPS